MASSYKGWKSHLNQKVTNSEKSSTISTTILQNKKQQQQQKKTLTLEKELLHASCDVLRKPDNLWSRPPKNERPTNMQ